MSLPNEPLPEPPRKRFPARRLAMLLGVLMGIAYIFEGVRPLITGRSGADIAQAALGLAITLPCAYMFWRYHAEG